MGISIWQFVLLAILIVIYIWLPVRILRRAGYSGWWVILGIIPLVNVVMIWVFAFSTWPATQRAAYKVEEVFE